MDIKDILNELSFNKVIDSGAVQYKPLMGGTTSRLFQITNSDDTRLVVKLNDPDTLRAEADYLKRYQREILPQLYYVAPSFQYIVYSFIPGSTDYTRGNKEHILKKLVKELINGYRAVEGTLGWGLAEDISSSWSDFLLEGINEASTFVAPYLGKEDENFVISLLKENRSEFPVPFLLHGDCGIHNFIFSEGELVGVIDPTPVLGEPHYDLLYAFCSTPDDLTPEAILPAFKALDFCKSWSLKRLYSDVLIVLYLRIATCIKHHPHDLEEYLKAWGIWKHLVKEGEFNE